MFLKRFAFVSLFLCLLLTLTSCSESMKTIDSNEPDVRTGGIQHGVVIPDPESSNFTFEYTGQPIELTYMMENGEVSDSWGLYVFTDGIQQPFCVDNEPESKLVYVYDFSPKERKMISISFQPITGDVGDSVQVVFVVMLDPEFILEKESDLHQYGNYHAITQMPWKIDIKSQINNKSNTQIPQKGTQVEISTDFQKRYEEVNENGEISSLLDSSVHFEFFNNDYYETEVQMNDGVDLEFTINAAGTCSGYDKVNYRLSIYANHTLLKVFDGSGYVDVEIQSGKITNLTVKIPCELLKGKDFVYLMASPIGDTASFLPIQKTESMPLIKN